MELWQEFQLFDIQKDPECLNNLIAGGKHNAVAEALKEKLDEELKKDGDFRALGEDTSWLDKVPWTAPELIGTWDSWLKNINND